MAPPLPQQVLAFIRAHNLFQPGDRLLVGVSGGPDSTALLHLLHRLAPRWPCTLGVAHFDHALRGEASQADARWVENLAASLNLPFFLGTGDVRGHQTRRKISLQTAARQLRGQFFRDIQQQEGYHRLALGHTADDQLELFFLRLLRGAGPEGMRGMTPASDRGIIRPLLETPKTRLIAWLAAAGLDSRLDESNLSPRYRRNQLRLELLPRLLAYNPRLGEAVHRFQELLQEQEDYLGHHTAQLLEALQKTGGTGEPDLPLTRLLALHPALQKRVLRLAGAQAGVPLERLTARHLAAILHLCRRPQPGGEISLPGAWRLIREHDRLIWRPTPPPLPCQDEYLLDDQEPGTCTAGDWTLTWSSLPVPPGTLEFPNDPMLAYMDFHQVHFPLRLRFFRPGDRFHPLGLRGAKKLQDFFVDAKIPRSRRPFIPLLVSRDQIVWVVGQRLADPVKVTPRTRRLLRFQAALRPAGRIPEPPR